MGSLRTGWATWRSRTSIGRRPVPASWADTRSWGRWISPTSGGSRSPAWLYYITISDLDGAVKKVTKQGGKIVVEPMEVPGGSRIAVGIDPHGAAFGLHQRAAM